MKNKYCINKVILILLSACAIFLMVIAYIGYAEYQAQAKVANIMILAAFVKTEITENLLKNPGEVFNNSVVQQNYGRCNDCEITYYHVSESGDFFIFSESLGVFLHFNNTFVLNKQNAKNTVNWECKGWPTEFVPLECRVLQE